MSELSLVPLTEVTTRREGEGLCFVLQMAGITAVTLPVRGHEKQPVQGPVEQGRWEVLVTNDGLERARQILADERPAPVAEPSIPAQRGFHWVVVLIVANLCAWVALEGAGGSENRGTLIKFGASYAPAVVAGEYWRTVTATFLHIGARHLLGNMITLALFGWLVISQEGLGRFYFVYVLSGVGGNWLSFLLSPRRSAKAGASGSILGLLGFLAGRRVRASRQPMVPTRFKTWHVVAMLIAFYGFVVGVGPADHLAHVGGIFVGFLAGLFLPQPSNTVSDRRLATGLGFSALGAVIGAGYFPLRLLVG